MSQIDSLNVAQDSDFFDPHDSRIIYPQRAAASNRSMVSAAHYEATNAGEALLADGGNAFDAAVAVAFALGVCEPAAWLQQLAEMFREYFDDVSINVPFSGGYIVASHSNELPWVQLEFSRSEEFDTEYKSRAVLQVIETWIDETF